MKNTSVILKIGEGYLEKFMRLAACLVLTAAFATPAAAEETLYPCSYPADILADFQKFDFPNDMEMTAKERAEKSQQIFDALLAKYPDNFFVQRRYQAYRHSAVRFAGGGDVTALVKEYQDLLAKHPDDPRYLYLYARMIYDTKPEEAILYHEKALQLAPNFPWPHLQLATIYGQGARDPAKRQAHLEAFIKMCPSSLEFYRYFGDVESKGFLRQSAQELRKRLDDHTDALALEAYDSLWAVEYRGSPPSEYKEVRERQAADLSRLRALNLDGNLKWYKTLYSGYKALGDTPGQKWVEEALLQNLPQSSYTFRLVTQRWMQEHPRPGENASTEATNAYYKALLSTATEWTRRWPKAPVPWMYRFQAVTQLKDVSDAEVEAAADGYMTTEENNTETVRPASVPLSIAGVYVKRGIRLDRVPQLVETAVEQSQKQVQQFSHLAGMPPDVQQMQTYMMDYVHWQGWSILVDDYVKTKQPDKAREYLVNMGSFLSANKPAESAKPFIKSSYTAESRDYWEKMALVAEAQSRKMDAMGYYLNALDIPRQVYRESDKEDETAQKARQLWKALGGTDAGWSVWTTQHAPPATRDGVYEWSKLDKPLPDFSLPDLSGHNWQLQNLKGKVTFLNVWATWCGPCQAEMPFVQKLYEEMKDKPDVQVVTLNIDENPGLIDPYLRNTNYTFPIIPATSLFVQIDQFMSIPRNWVVDASGVLRREQLGFASKNDEWINSAAKAVEEVRAGK